ncbi:MAG: hypothetical protein H6739_15970 [Alphaproteobacteria bacterium]|nr:hypothetical protein [Alphaproteobacteria bacterium]
MSCSAASLRRLGAASALALSPAAWAGEPVTTHWSGDQVTASATLSQPPAALRAAFDQAILGGGLSPNVTSEEVLERNGACTLVRQYVRLGFLPSTFDSLRCATADGWVEDMVGGPAFQEMTSIWRIEPAGPGTKVSLTVHCRVSHYLPESLERAGVENATLGTVEALLERLSE